MKGDASWGKESGSWTLPRLAGSLGSPAKVSWWLARSSGLGGGEGRARPPATARRLRATRSRLSACSVGFLPRSAAAAAACLHRSCRRSSQVSVSQAGLGGVLGGQGSGESRGTWVGGAPVRRRSSVKGGRRERRVSVGARAPRWAPRLASAGFSGGKRCQGKAGRAGGRTRGVLSGALDGLKRRDVLLCSVCLCVCVL